MHIIFSIARLARVVVPGYPHHITQRGNRRQQTFFCDEDYEEYISLMTDWCSQLGVQIWFYCLMPNHVHLIAVPESEDGLRRAVGEAHRRYTRRINFREGWRGHLWQGRFASFVMDNKYLLSAVRYVAMNPVKAGLARRPEDYRWSSASTYLNGRDDSLTKVSGLNEIVDDWQDFLSQGVDSVFAEKMRKHEQTGRPLGSQSFVAGLEKILDRILRPQKPGRKPNKVRKNDENTRK